MQSELVMQTELVTEIHNPAVDLSVRDLLLNALAVSSGAVDAISFLALGKVFSAFMTGNIAFLGLRVAGASAPGGVAIVVSMAAFAVGVYLSTRIVRPSEGTGMWPQRVTVALGASLIAHAVFLAVWFASNGQPSIDAATIILLVGDMTNWPATVAERRRLASVLVSLFVGATAGGLLLVHAHIYAPVLPFVITGITVATAAIAFRESRM